MIARTAPMGWNSWNTFGPNINEELIRQMADVMVEKGYRDAGYEYLVIDDCWSLKQRDENGLLVADPEKFPHGMKAVADGMTPLQAVLISATNLTSAGQFAGLPLMLSNASLMEMALTQLIINLRYALMSLSLSQKLDESMNTLSRMLFSFANTDEIFAVASSQPGRDYLFGLMFTPYFGWTIGTLLGAVAGTLLPEFFRTALGIAIYGMFLAIILPPAKREEPVRLVVLIAIGLSLCLRYIPWFSGISSGFAIIICAVAASAIGAWLHPVGEVKQQ